MSVIYSTVRYLWIGGAARGCVYLKVAGGRRSEDLNVGGVGVGELQPVSQPHYGNVAGMSLNLAADVHSVSLPGVNCNIAMDFWSI